MCHRVILLIVFKILYTEGMKWFLQNKQCNCFSSSLFIDDKHANSPISYTVSNRMKIYHEHFLLILEQKLHGTLKKIILWKEEGKRTLLLHPDLDFELLHCCWRFSLLLLEGRQQQSLLNKESTFKRMSRTILNVLKQGKMNSGKFTSYQNYY